MDKLEETAQMDLIKQEIEKIKLLGRESGAALEIHRINHAAICRAVARADEFLADPNDSTYDSLVSASQILQKMMNH